MNISYRKDDAGLLWQFLMVISTQEDIKNVICALKVIIIEIDSGIFLTGEPTIITGDILKENKHIQ